MALRVFPENLSLIGPDIDFLKSNKVLEKNNWMHCTLSRTHSTVYFCLRMREKNGVRRARRCQAGCQRLWQGVCRLMLRRTELFLAWTSYCSWLIRAGQLSFCWTSARPPLCEFSKVFFSKASNWESGQMSVDCGTSKCPLPHQWFAHLPWFLRFSSLKERGYGYISKKRVCKTWVDSAPLLRWWLRSSTESDGREGPSGGPEFFCSHGDCVAEGMGRAYRDQRYWVTFVAVCLPRVLKGIFFCVFIFRTHNQNTSRKDRYKRNSKTQVTCDKSVTLQAHTHTHARAHTHTRTHTHLCTGPGTHCHP